MSLQWSLVATFLYVELAVVILLLLPVISPRTWQKFFKSRFLESLGRQANLYFGGFLVVLIMLFVDSIREMNRYSTSRENEEGKGHLDSELQYSMKLFRAQRNFYIAGFALFLCLVIRRLVLLISRQAVLLAERDAALSQAKGASATARNLMETSAATSSSATATSPELNKLKDEVKELNKKLEAAKASEAAVKRQAESTNKEYDRLMKEHASLQQKIEKLEKEAPKKDK